MFESGTVNLSSRACRCCRKHSEFIAQGELHHAGIHHALEFAKGRWRSQSQAWVCEVDVIKHVEGLRPKLNPLAFPRQLEFLCHRHIRVKERSQSDSSALPSVPWKLVRERIRGTRVRKHAGIPVLINMHSAFDGTRYDRERTQPVVGVVLQTACHRRRQPCPEPSQTGNLPATDDRI